MSFNTVFNTYEDVITFLKNHDYPQCFTVNYRPREDDYELWIGNQPYENYEKEIEKLEESLLIARVGRRDLTDYVKRLKEENKKMEIEIEKVFDNWALGNFDDEQFHIEIQLIVHKFKRD